jgi:hypothetical protein
MILVGCARIVRGAPLAVDELLALAARIACTCREALCRTRTGDPFLTMEVLYQLS